MKVVKLQNSDMREMLAALQALRRNIEPLLEAHKVMAHVRKKVYDMYIAEGFTSEQALELCKDLSGGGVKA